MSCGFIKITSWMSPNFFWLVKKTFLKDTHVRCKWYLPMTDTVTGKILFYLLEKVFLILNIFCCFLCDKHHRTFVHDRTFFIIFLKNIKTFKNLFFLMKFLILLFAFYLPSFLSVFLSGSMLRINDPSLRSGFIYRRFSCRCRVGLS